jgi:hypothetical protein
MFVKVRCLFVYKVCLFFKISNVCFSIFYLCFVKFCRFFPACLFVFLKMFVLLFSKFRFLLYNFKQFIPRLLARYCALRGAVRTAVRWGFAPPVRAPPNS